MIDALLDALQKSWPMAIGIALSPGPVLAVIVLIMSRHAKTSAPAFLIGWLVPLIGVGILIIFIPGVLATHGGLSDTTGIVKIIVGIVLMIVAIPIWKKRPKSGAEMEVPKMFKEIDKFGMGKAFLVGLLTSAFDIKVLALTASASAHIHATNLVEYTETIIGVILFTLLASLTIILPIIVYFLSPKKMKLFAEKFKAFLLKYYTPIIVMMLLIFGLVLIYIGLKIYLT
jgi:hypothetical protein